MTKTSTPVPSDVHQLTARWLTQRLSDCGVLGRDQVSEVSLEPIGEGRGFVGQLFRCHLTYQPNLNAGPRTVIAKLASDDAERRALFQEFGLYEREVQFYRELARETPVPTPRCYFAGIEKESGGSVILLEDLAPSIPGDPIGGCSPEQAADAIRLIAPMHIRWWRDPQLTGRFSIPRPNVESTRRRVESHFEEAWSEFSRRHGKHLPRELLRLGRRLGQHLPTILDRLSSPPLTLVHGDYQLGNIFYGSDGQIRAVADWQVIVRARGIMDVSYLLVRSLDPEARRANEVRLVEDYHRILLAEGIRGYSQKECWDDYRLAALSQFGLGIVLAHALGPDSRTGSGAERLDSIAAVVGGRLVAALMDLQPLEVVEIRPWWRRLRRGQ